MTQDSSSSAAPATKPKRRRKWGRYVLAALAVLGITGAVYQAIGSALSVGKYPPVGRMVPVGDHSMHIYCTGAGSPTVVLESGLSEGALSWSAVQPEISKTTRVCSYDRSGYFWSEPSQAERSSDVIARELMTLLTNAGEKGSYVLVGHSIGGLHVRAFSSRYPDQVVGMVLVDSSHEQQNSRLGYPSWTNAAFRVQTFLMKLGLGRALGTPQSNWRPLPPELQPAYRELGFLNRSYDESLREKIASDALDATGVQPNSIRPDLPLVVLSQNGKGVNQDQYKAFVQLHDELAALSSRSTHIVATAAGHYIQLDEPQLVIDSVRQVLSQARGK